MTDNSERFYGFPPIPVLSVPDFVENKMQCVTLTKSREHQCAWERSDPSGIVFFMYAIAIPVMTMFGFLANFLNALVFMRPKMSPSVFTYLSVLSWIDCLCCLIILLTCLSRSIFFDSPSWIWFDFQWQTPLFGILTGAANWILAAVTLDRMIYLRHGLPQSPPKFCTKRVARRNICGVLAMSTILNTPYFFIFIVREDGTFITTPFYSSSYYKVHNWMTFTVLCIVPGLFLLIGNTIVIIIFRRWVIKSQALQGPHTPENANIRNRYRHQIKLTITVIIVVFLYLIGELPAHITSRKSALNLLFGGDASKIHFQTVEEFEVIFLTLNAIQLSLNIIVYSVVNPAFMTEFFTFLEGAADTFLMLIGITALIKCWQNIQNKNGINSGNPQIEAASDKQDQASVSYYNETVNEEGKNRELEGTGSPDTWRIYRKWKSSYDLHHTKKDYNEWIKSGRILQRHSLSL